MKAFYKQFTILILMILTVSRAVLGQGINTLEDALVSAYQEMTPFSALKTAFELQC